MLELIFTPSILTFNIITTNKNKTAIAPTYTIKNKKDRNSAPSSNKILAVLQNTTIKNKTEYTAFDRLTTIQADIKEIIEKIQKRVVLVIMYF